MATKYEIHFQCIKLYDNILNELLIIKGEYLCIKGKLI